MLFNSINFVIFFSILFLVYYFVLDEKTKFQNWLLLLSSYFFYGFADLKMLSLLIGSTLVFFYLGKFIGAEYNSYKSSWYTKIAVILGVGLLIYFKYMNFFIESFASLFGMIGLRSNFGTFNIIIPLGISFFTFKLISYVIDIHRRKIEPAEDLIAFATYVAFFPTIMSGPIDRPNLFIPQLLEKRIFDYSLAVDGSRQILWGLFQKLVIADNLAIYTNQVWANISDYSGSTLLLIAVFYAFQLYTDFSGYSHIAIGVGKLLGFRITANFNYPFFSRDVAEYWRKWHMSLTSWLTDYVFIPLNVEFRNYGNYGIILAIMINMLVVGMWHGANFTFAVFGIYHGLLFIPLILSGKIFKKSKKLIVNRFGIPSSEDLIKMLSTFMLVTLGLVIFRAKSMTQTLEYFSRMFSRSIFSIPQFQGRLAALLIVFGILIMVVIEWIQRRKDHPLQIDSIVKHRQLRWLIYYTLLSAFWFFSGEGQQFVYFQF
jgi:alginate O-acetyltransferase complex protein AlgI